MITITLTTTMKVQIVVSPEQAQLLKTTMDAYRQACNFVAKHVFKTHDLKQASLNTALYTELRKSLRSQKSQTVLKTVIARYKTILQNEHEWIQPEFRLPQLDLVWNRDYSLSKGLFSVNTLEGRIKVPFYDTGMESYFAGDYKFGTAKLVEKHGKYYLHIPVSCEVEDVVPSDICNVVGVDRGINFLVTTYDSNGKTTFVNGRHVKQKRAQYAKTRKSLQRRKTPAARRRLKQIGHRENRWMRDVNHCVSKALVDNNPQHTLFVLEDLTGIRSATERVRLRDRYVSVSWAFYDLEQKLKYKAQRAGSAVINVNPAYTSQTCPKCGHTAKNNRNKKTHVFCCKNCGYTSNDDRIAAMNLHRMGIDYLVPDAVTAEQAPL